MFKRGAPKKILTFSAFVGTIASPYVIGAEHQFHAHSRLRAASVEAPDNDGKAASILLRGGVSSDWNERLSSELEVDIVSSMWKDEHSNGVDNNGKPFIPDVPGAEVNQLYLSYELGAGNFYLGRRRIELDDQRFIGSNDFWQNDQTFDAIAYEHNFASASKWQYHYIANVNRIFGDGADGELSRDDPLYESTNGERPARLLGDHEHKTHLLHVDFREWDYHQLTGFLYYIDNVDAENTSNKTLGLRYNFEKRFRRIKPFLTLSHAVQENLNHEDPARVDYSLVEGGIGIKSLSFSARYEELGSEDGQSFTTPLASLHNFHGWADKFSVMPPVGIVDTSVRLFWRKKPWKIDIRYHTFESSARSIDWGNELDIDIILKINRHHKVLLRYSDFRSDAESRARFPDEERIFLNYSFEY